MATKFEKCMKFHRDNPKIYAMFEYQVLRAITKGRKKISAYAIIEWIRWEFFVITKSDDPYRIANEMKPFYARLFVFYHPKHINIFDFHESTKVDYGYLDVAFQKERNKNNQLNMF